MYGGIVPNQVSDPRSRVALFALVNVLFGVRGFHVGPVAIRLQVRFGGSPMLDRDAVFRCMTGSKRGHYGQA